MQPLVMVEPEVTADAGVRLRDQLVVFPVPLFILQRPPPSLDKNVVQIAPSSVPARGEKGNILARKRSIPGVWGLGPYACPMRGTAGPCAMLQTG